MSSYKDYLFALPIFLFIVLQSNTIRNYDKSFSVMLYSFMAHAIKTVISYFLHKKKYKNYKKVIIIVFFFQCQTYLLYKYSKLLSPLYSAVCTQSKFIFLCILSVIILKRKYDVLQYLGLAIIFYATIHGSNVWSKDNKGDGGMAVYIAAGFTMLSGFFGGFGNVFFEKYVRKEIYDFFGYQFVYEVISTLLSFVFLCLELYKRDIDLKANFKDYNLYLIVVIMIYGSTLISYASTKICPVKRTILTVMTGFLGSYCVQMWRKEDIKMNTIVALILVIIGIIVYEHKNIRIMFTRRYTKG